MTETEYYKENKMCCVCNNFMPFMGSAGVCKAENGCACQRMIDCMDICRNNKFEYCDIYDDTIS